ncbi:BT_3987 domain-containing protein [Bacteroides intestinalis]|uniref:BT_3987 domain-containing protein n=1 Tax=Bacteroides intestinalis TaxID=329854 RepID=UPI0018A0BF77|nr:DUF1735 domain-containing protein [Bacteroides intestinalis]
MKKHKQITAALLLSVGTFFSCEDGLKDNLTESKVYLVSSGLQEFEIYKTGTPSTYQLAIYKSGAVETSCTASVGLCSVEELEAYNTQYETEYKMMTNACYEITSSSVSFDADRKDVNRVVDIIFKPEAIEELGIGKYVLPVKLTEASIGITNDKAMVILAPTVIEPMVYFASSGAKLNLGLGAADMTQNLKIGFNASNTQNIVCNLVVDEDYLAAYNAASPVQFELLPESAYTLPASATIVEDTKEVTAKVALAVSTLPLGNYLLPIRLSSDQFKIREGNDMYVVEIVITNPVLDTKKWTITANTEEPAEAAPNGRPEAIIDGDINSFWHSQWSGGWQDWPHIIIIDMKDRCEVLSIDYYGRQSGGDANTKDMEFFVSDNQSDWKSIGKFEAKKTADMQEFETEEAEGRYLKVEITSSHDGSNNTSIGELIVHGTVM